MTESAVVLLGPSGAGKSDLAQALRDTLGWSWIEADVLGVYGANGLAVHGLRNEWIAFLKRDPVPLRDALCRRAQSAHCAGVVLSLSSVVTVSADNMISAAASSLYFFVLFGTQAECLAAFLERERRTGRGLDEAHWQESNRRSYRLFAAPEIASFRLPTFFDGKHRSRQALIEDVVGKARKTTE